MPGLEGPMYAQGLQVLEVQKHPQVLDLGTILDVQVGDTRRDLGDVAEIFATLEHEPLKFRAGMDGVHVLKITRTQV